MICSLVGSGHPGKYSYEIPHEYSKGSGNLSGKIISVKRNDWSNLVSFYFQIAISPFTYVATFSRQLYFARSYFLTLLQSNYFNRTVTFSGQLFSPFAEQSLFGRSYFFRIASFSEQTLFENKRFFTAVTFHNSYFIRTNCLG